MRKGLHVFGVLSLLASLFVFTPATFAEPAANDPFLRTWQRTDKPIADGNVTRTWMWGPAAFTSGMSEDYVESPSGQRTVQYFDKSRMEITDPNGDESSPWYVTNGLLVVELVTGQMQVGNSTFVPRSPAQVNVAGDADDTAGPTYATFASLRDVAALAEGATITQRVNRAGAVTNDETLAGLGVSAARYVPATDHTVASPFWAFMQSAGTVWENGGTTTAPLFQDPFYATGYPISEAYWATVKVGGTPRDVLLQCFERRCLTYTPDNPVEWQVEAGNVGQHYYRWRYPEAPAGPGEQANALTDAVINAHSDEAREAALLEVMDALGIGVYSATGAQIVGGAERGAGDFYLYELEIELMAKALGRAQAAGTSPELAAAGFDDGDLLTVEDLAMTLTSLPVLEGGAAVDPELLRQVIVEGAQAAQASPNDSSSLGPLVARQLGLSHEQPYDLFTNVPIEQLRFDPLQSFLILSDILLPIVAESGPVEVGGTQIVAQSKGILATTSDVHPCEDAVGTGVKEGWSGGKWAAGFIKKIGNPVKIAAVAIDGIHGSMLAYSVLVYSLDQTLDTHYGHESAGEALRFRVKVEMVDELPENVVKCGWLLGVEFPKKGPIKDVGMVWQQPQLGQHGTVICTETCVKTAPDGIATLIFQPKQEDQPGRGWVVEERGTVTGYAMYQSRHKNVLGSISQIITPKSGATAWTVTHHQIPGYDVTLTVQYDVHLHDYPTPPMYPHDHDYTASGKVTYNIFVPDGSVIPPYEETPVSWTQGASGSGTEAIVTIGNGGGGDYQCSGAYSGQWISYAEIEDDGAKSRGERMRYIRFRPEEPDDANYTGNCGDHLWIDSYTNADTYPWIDLQATGTTTKEYDPCPTSHSEDITCEGNIKWTIKVKRSGFDS